MVGEPDMLNPNSFENLSVILQSLSKRAKIAKYSPLISIYLLVYLFIYLVS